MWIPIFSATLLQALFGKQLFAEPTPAPDFAQRAGYRLGPNGEWIAADGEPLRHQQEEKDAVVIDIGARRAR